MANVDQRDIMRIPYQRLHEQFVNALVRHGFSDANADVCAEVFASNSLEGVASHGVNRFPRFIEYVKKGFIDPGATSVLVCGAGALEQWDGRLGPGPLNAIHATDRAIAIAKESGIGCVALANTNHWMRGGFYGKRAALNGSVFIGWSNTIANMPAWGARDRRLGNNPIVLAVPHEPEPVVLDMAMTQFSYGTLESKQMRNEQLPITGGYTIDGESTTDPSAIITSQRAMPMGYWKGSGLAMLLDLIAAVLSGGLSTHELSKRGSEYAVSQIFIAFDLSQLSNRETIGQLVQSIVDDVTNSIPAEGGDHVRIPGTRVRREREENLKFGIPVDRKVWEELKQIVD
jgi:3-dehydro-L-gulonate 2-dehydrogenase